MPSWNRYQVLAQVVLGLALQAVCAQAAGTTPVKNVIVLIADGCSSEQYTLARWFQGKPLALDGILVGGLKTYINDSVVADSAPASTAFATGFRTSDKFIGVGPKPGALRPDLEPAEDVRYRPLATVLEGARLLGKATGVVATSRVTHATPAAYVAHVTSRKLEEDIMIQAVHQNVDVLLGGGKDYLLPRSKQGKRRDGEDLSALLRARGYAVVEDRAGLAAAKSGRVFGAFAMGPMAAEIDRPHTRPQEPNLAEMARKAIELLSSDPDGFFLMIEGSQIDWACHANDPAHLLGDLVMFDEAVNVALDFAKSDGNTLVLAFSDHNTGGMSIGNRATSRTYSQMGVEELIGPFKRMKASAPEMWRKLCAPRDPEEVKPDQVKPQDVQKVVEECWGISLSLNEARHLLQVAGLDSENPHNAFGAVICPKWTNVGFTSHGHTGGDVPLFAFGPGAPVGLLDGPAIGALSASALGLDLEKLNQRLYVDLQREVADARVSVVDSGENKLVVRVLLGDRSAELPVHKNILTIAGKSIELEGLVVYVAETKKAYLPLQAVQLLRGQPVCLPSIARQ